MNIKIELQEKSLRNLKIKMCKEIRIYGKYTDSFRIQIMLE